MNKPPDPPSPVVTNSSDMGRLNFAMKDRDEVFIVEYRDNAPRHGIATPTSVSWLATDKHPADIEVAEDLSPVEWENAVTEAEDTISRWIFPGESSSDVKPR